MASSSSRAAASASASSAAASSTHADDGKLMTVACARVACQFIEMLETRLDIIDKHDLHIGDKRMMDKTISIDEYHKNNNNNGAAANNDDHDGGNDRRRSNGTSAANGDDDDYHPDDDHYDTKDIASLLPSFTPRSATAGSGGGNGKKHPRGKKQKQTIEVVMVYSKSGALKCMETVRVKQRRHQQCDNCKKLTTRLRAYHRATDNTNSRYNRRAAGEKQRETRRIAREQSQLDRQRARVADEAKRREAALAAATAASAIRRTAELSHMERNALRTESASVAHWIHSNTSLGLSFDDISSSAARQSAASSAAKRDNNPKKRGRPRLHAMSAAAADRAARTAAAIAENLDGDSTGYESDVEVVLSDDDDDIIAKRRRTEPAAVKIAPGALQVIVEDTTPLPDYRHVMVAMHQHETPQPDLCAQATFDFHYATMVQLVRRTWRRVCQHHHNPQTALPATVERELVCLASTHFEHILHAADTQRTSLPPTRGSKRGDIHVWQRVFVNALRSLQLPGAVIRAAEQRLRAADTSAVTAAAPNMNDNNKQIAADNGAPLALIHEEDDDIDDDS